MPNIKSAKKRMRSSEKQRIGNTAVKTKVKTARRQAREALSADNADAASESATTRCWRSRIVASHGRGEGLHRL